MKAHLLSRGEEFGWKAALQAAEAREAVRGGRQSRGENFDRRAGLPWNADTLSMDLGLGRLFEAMAAGDGCVFEVVRRVLLAGVVGDLDTILYRQAVLQDCLHQRAVVRALYGVAVEAAEMQRRHYLGSFLIRYPDAVLRHSIELMAGFLHLLAKLRKIADAAAEHFASEGWRGFFATLRQELDDGYLADARRHLEELKFRDGVLLSARMGRANKGGAYVLRRLPRRRTSWVDRWRELAAAAIGRVTGRGETGTRRLRPQNSPVYSFALAPRDEAGARALGELRNRGIALVADALAQSGDHVRDFFGMLRAELGFYVGCINLHERLANLGEPVCIPALAPAEKRVLSCRGLYDASLALTAGGSVVGNDIDGDGKALIMITGANQGGKSTFLRSLGLAQLMMQSGMFVPAAAYRSSLCNGLFTHFKREEDPGMRSGKLDEELARASEIVDRVAANSLILFNESFAATNEREGSEIARQIMTALLDNGIRIACVTHLYELAHDFFQRHTGTALFLRAERARSFKLREGEPLPTSYGEDLYRSVFADPDHGDVIPTADPPELSAAS
jgi:hypothetical protein